MMPLQTLPWDEPQRRSQYGFEATGHGRKYVDDDRIAELAIGPGIRDWNAKSNFFPVARIP